MKEIASTTNMSFNVNGSVYDHEPFITKEIYNQFLLVVDVVLIPAVCVFGLIGNSVTLAVLRHSSGRQTSNFTIYMTTLLVAHISRNFISLVFSVARIAYIYDFYIGNLLEQHMRRQYVYFFKLLDVFSSCDLLIMSGERFMVLLRPMTFKEIRLSRCPRGLLVSIFVFFAITLLPFPLCCEVEARLNSENKTQYYFYERNAAWKHFMDTYVFLVTVVQHYVVPLCILFVNIAITFAYVRYTKEVTQSPLDIFRSNQQAKLTVVVLTIGIFYLLMSFPTLFGLTLDFVNEEYSFTGKYSHIYHFFIRLGTLTLHFNSAFDCILYIVVYKHFWSVLRLIICKCYIVQDERKSLSFSRNSKYSLNKTISRVSCHN